MQPPGPANDRAETTSASPAQRCCAVPDQTVVVAGRGLSRRYGLGDRDLTKLRREHIGFIFQFFNLLPMLTAEENVVLPLRIAGERPDRD